MANISKIKKQDGKTLVANVNKLTRSNGGQKESEILDNAKSLDATKAKNDSKAEKVSTKKLSKEKKQSKEPELTAYERLAKQVKERKRLREENQNEDTECIQNTGSIKRSKGSNEVHDSADRNVTVQARYVENDQVITFNVDAYDSFYETDNEEIQDTDLDEDLDDLEPDQLLDSENQVVAHCSKELQAGEITPKRATANMQISNQGRIRQLEKEMKDRLLEIKTTMQAGGMEDTLRECFEDELANMSTPGNKNRQEDKNRGKPRQISNKLDKQGCNDNHNAAIDQFLEKARSEITVYKNAVEKRGSSSSEEELGFNNDNSDEFLNNMMENLLVVGEYDKEQQTGRKDRSEVEQPNSPVLPMGRERTDQVIKDAEAAKAKIFPPKGKALCQMGIFEFVAKIDQDYLSLGSHVDQLTQEKIKKGEYVDFSKLLPKDRVLVEEDSRMELVIRNGQTFWTPVSEAIAINSFSKWEQAFRIFANIYTSEYLQRSSELIQYNHIIHSIAGTYTWENVYVYDREFRLHISRHPERSWSVILQQAWSMKLRDRIICNDNVSNNNGHSHFHQAANSQVSPGSMGTKSKINEPCCRFNRGKCKFGASCRYEHRCSYCHKFGHTVINCRKLIADQERSGKKNGSNKEHKSGASA